MTWNVVVDTRVRKQLRKIPQDYSKRIFRAIEEFGSNPFIGDIDKIGGEKDLWRRRIGDYRIFYEINQGRKIVYVFEVKRRTSTTY